MSKLHFIVLIVITGLMLAPDTFAQSSCDEEQSCGNQVQEYAYPDGSLFPVPDIASLAVDQNLLYDRWYKRVQGTVDVFDAPNGNIIRTIDTGFNFVTVLREENGWSQINSNEWVATQALTDTSAVVSSFTGILLPEDTPDHTIAWVLVNLYPSPEPGANPSEQFDFVPRYTRVSIHDTAVVDGYSWYLIGENQWVHQFNVAKILPLNAPPTEVDTDNWVSIDLYEQIIIAYENNTPVFATLVSTGLPRWPTYEGTFNIYFRRTRDFMSWGTVGDDFYSLEEVPWTMFFDEGRALHGAYWHDGFGYRRSHGCVNMSITDAKWLYEWVADDMGKHQSADYETGPAVYVYSSGEYDEK